MWTKDYIYMINDDEKVPYKSPYTLDISKNTCCSLAPNELTTRPINWIKFIIDYFIYMLMKIINKY